MFEAQCVLCGYKDKNSDGAALVNHINEEHSGGLQKYLLFFGAIPLVGSRLQKACEKYVYAGVKDPELGTMSDADIKSIVEAAKRCMPERSVITVSEDF